MHHPLYCRAPHPVPYPSLTCLASLGLVKGRGQTLYLIFLYNRLLQLYNRLLHPPLNFFKTIRCHREPLHVPEVSHGTSSLTPPPLTSLFPLPLPYPSLTCQVSLGLVKGRGQTLYLIFFYPTKPPHSLSHTCPLFVPYLSVTHPLPVPYLSPTCLLPIPYLIPYFYTIELDLIEIRLVLN